MWAVTFSWRQWQWRLSGTVGCSAMLGCRSRMRGGVGRWSLIFEEGVRVFRDGSPGEGFVDPVFVGVGCWAQGVVSLTLR